MCKTTSYLSDIDRLWVEIRGQEPVAVFDLKFEQDRETWAEQIIRDWFESHRVPYYVLIVGRSGNGDPCPPFKLRRGNEILDFLSQDDLIAWIDSGLPDSIFDIQMTPEQLRKLEEV
jgi:hypothetical protein